jgi:hypothetical protein
MLRTMVGVLAVAVALSFAGLALAQDKGKAKGDGGKKAAVVRGVVASIDADKKTVTVTAKQKDGTTKDVVVETDDNTKVTVDGKDATFADLKAGMKVTVTPAEGKATKVEAKPAKERGAGRKAR